MSRDYKRPIRREPEQQGNPMLKGMAIGLIGGVALSIGVSLAYLKMTAPKPAVAVAGKTGKQKANSDARKSQTKIEFYEILPGKKDPASSAPATKAEPPAEGPAVDNASSPAASNTASPAYYLQAGSFSSAADADNLKANLAMLLGDEAKVQTVTMADHTIMHRVRLGPYKDLETAKQKQAQLASQNIDAVLQKGTPARSAE